VKASSLAGLLPLFSFSGAIIPIEEKLKWSELSKVVRNVRFALFRKQVRPRAEGRYFVFSKQASQLFS